MPQAMGYGLTARAANGMVSRLTCECCFTMIYDSYDCCVVCCSMQLLVVAYFVESRESRV